MNKSCLHLDCICHDAGHSVRFSEGFDQDDEEAVTIDVQLNQYYTFWDRLTSGIKYIFTGIGSVGWDTVILSKKDTLTLIKFLEEQSGIKRF